MKVTASLNYLRVSPRKVRAVVDIVRGMRAEDALTQLAYANKRAAEPIAKLLRSAIANAEHNVFLDKNTLTIASIKVDEGPSLKRYKAKGFGRASQIHRKTSHITVVLEGERMPEAPKKKRKETAAQIATTDTASDVVGQEKGKEEVREKTLRETEKTMGERKKDSFSKRIFRRKSI